MIDLEDHISIQDEFIHKMEGFTTGKNREKVLQHHQELFILLNELKNYRDKDESLIKVHGISNHSKGLRNEITSITCTCGETTRYKVPLNSLSDFECPKRKR